MEINILLFINLLAYSFIVSQSFSYIIAFRDVQQAMDATAYIELRKLLDKNFRKKFRFVVYFSLATSALFTLLCSMNPNGLLFIGSAISLVALIIDAILTVKGNMPVNNIINGWSTKNYSPDLQTYRAKWLSVYIKRQVASITGFLCLLMGAVFG